MDDKQTGLDLSQVGADAIEIIRERPGLLCLDDLAADLNISRRHLQRAFERRETSFQAERTSARMEQAAKLMARGYPVWLAARQCGYRSASHFGFVFSQTFGVSPRELGRAAQLYRRLEWRIRQDESNPARVGSSEYQRRGRRRREDSKELRGLVAKMRPAAHRFVPSSPPASSRFARRSHGP